MTTALRLVLAPLMGALFCIFLPAIGLVLLAAVIVDALLARIVDRKPDAG